MGSKKSKKKLTINEKILADVDDEMHLLTKRIELKYSLTWAKANKKTNRAVRILALSFPEHWLKD